MRRYSFISMTLFLAALLASGCTPAQTEGDADHDHHHHEHEEGAPIEVSQKQMDAVGIEVGKMEERVMSASITATGTLELPATGMATVSAVYPGVVRKICVAEGSKVKKGAVVAYVEAPEINALRNERQLALREVEAAEREVARQQALSSQGAGVRKNLDRAQSDLQMARTRLEGVNARMRDFGVAESGSGSMYAVRADISGTVTEIPATIGSYADMQTPIAKIVDLNGMYCRLSLPEKDVAAVTPGVEVELALVSNPDCRFAGKVQEITPVVGAESRMVGVRVELSGLTGDERVYPGMMVSASIGAAGEKVEALPEGAVVSAGGKNFIFVLSGTEEEDGETMQLFEKREVAAGMRSGGYVQVTPLEPLAEDADVVTKGAFFLNSMSTEHGEHNH